MGNIFRNERKVPVSINFFMSSMLKKLKKIEQTRSESNFVYSLIA